MTKSSTSMPGTTPISPPKYIDNFYRYKALEKGWSYSHQFLASLRTQLAENLSSNVVTVAMAGSFGRLEGSAASDADYILIVEDTSTEKVAPDKDFINDAIRKYDGVSPPNKAGVFSEPRTIKQLLESVGDADEDSDLLGKRMLLLLESRAAYNDSAYADLMTTVFSKYAEYLKGDSGKEYVFLLNDLIRYFRFICVNYQASFWRENEKWVIRNVKLRHSRVIMYAGLLFLIGEASKYREGDKIEFVRNNLKLTPLERLGLVYQKNNDHGFFRLIGLYNVFLSRLSDKEWREDLNVNYEQRYSEPAFSEMKANSDALIAELLRFVFARRGQWSDRFFEYLLF